jgi:uncharacterized protein DUF3658
MSYVTKKWQKIGRIVSNVMVSEMNDGIRQTDDMLLEARIDALAKGGLLEIRGASVREIFKSEVRLAKARSRRCPA